MGAIMASGIVIEQRAKALSALKQLPSFVPLGPSSTIERIENAEPVRTKRTGTAVTVNDASVLGVVPICCATYLELAAGISLRLPIDDLIDVAGMDEGKRMAPCGHVLRAQPNISLRPVLTIVGDTELAVPGNDRKRAMRALP
jgi:hypothetical protein